MKKTSVIFSFSMFLFSAVFSQNYTSYFTGNSTDLITNPTGGVCLMGGATEDDNAMRWFLQRADGGDVLVIRASGSDGYNDYMYSDLGETINSVESIVFNNASAAQETYIVDRINKAEAIWMAGGNQWNYVSYWRNTPISAAINEAINNRNIVIGGTSAGMAILGGAYFSAENGTVTSAQALGDPYHNRVTISNEPFIETPFLGQVITDTHYDDPDRRGRHTTFLARAFTDYGQPYYGLACEEFTAVCISPDGIANVYGGFPDFDDKAFFIVPNCEFSPFRPEICTPGQPLNWDRNAQALKVYEVQGTPTGLYSFDLNTWDNGSGGDWLEWAAINGNFQSQTGTVINCMPVGTEDLTDEAAILLYPNPVTGQKITIVQQNWEAVNLHLFTSDGREIMQWAKEGTTFHLNFPAVPAGIYHLKIEQKEGVIWKRIVVNN